jgi:ligand-binding SRPBCC domain-containing protein
VYKLKASIHIDAPIDRCFMLSTSIPVVALALKMNPVEGKTTGLAVKNDRILWRGWKFGLPQMHQSIISQYRRPDFFEDTMLRGRFKYFRHEHHFRFIDGQTFVWDEIFFSMHLSALGGNLIADKIVVPHIMETLRTRHRILKRIAEGRDWQRYLEGVPLLDEAAQTA